MVYVWRWDDMGLSIVMGVPKNGWFGGSPILGTLFEHYCFLWMFQVKHAKLPKAIVSGKSLFWNFERWKWKLRQDPYENDVMRLVLGDYLGPKSWGTNWPLQTPLSQHQKKTPPRIKLRVTGFCKVVSDHITCARLVYLLLFQVFILALSLWHLVCTK